MEQAQSNALTSTNRNGRNMWQKWMMVSHYRLSNTVRADAVTCGDQNENGQAQEEQALMDSKSMVHISGVGVGNATRNNINGLQDKSMKISTLA